MTAADMAQSHTVKSSRLLCVCISTLNQPQMDSQAEKRLLYRIDKSDLEMTCSVRENMKRRFASVMPPYVGVFLHSGAREGPVKSCPRILTDAWSGDASEQGSSSSDQETLWSQQGSVLV